LPPLAFVHGGFSLLALASLVIAVNLIADSIESVYGS
jgi:hypothetical protein